MRKKLFPCSIKQFLVSCRSLNKTESLIQFVEDRKGHDVRYSLDVSKIHNELGWGPETAFDVGMAETIQWYEEEYGENSL